MKLHEALNLYGLHKNPEQLDKYDNAKDSLVDPKRWACLNHSTTGVEFTSGNSSLDKLSRVFVHEHENIYVGYFAVDSLYESISDDRNGMVDSGRYSDALIRKYDRGAAKLIDSIAEVQPLTMMSFGSDDFIGIAIFAHDLNSVKISFSYDD